MGRQDEHEELRRLVDEQTALRHVATLVAAGADEAELVAAVTAEVARLFGADTANTMRWEGETIRVLGDWSADDSRPSMTGRVFSYGGDTITARVVNSGAPARIESVDDLDTPFARQRWIELGLHASIGAPIVLDDRVWGVVTASRRTQNDPFPPGAEERLGDFAALVAQAIANAEARRDVAALAEEQAALRRVAMLVAGGRPQAEVLEAVSHEANRIFEAEAVLVVRWEGVHDEVVIVDGSIEDGSSLSAGSLYHPAPDSATITVLETGSSIRVVERSPEFGERSAISAPVIVDGRLLGALTALRSTEDPFPPAAEIRLRSFADLAAQSIANVRAREEMRASRARIVRAADEARAKLERNLHDGAQQRLVAVLISLRMATAKLSTAPEEARDLMLAATAELEHAFDELRELARGIHPSVLTERGLGPALELLAERAPLRVAVAHELDERLPAPVEAAAYFVVAESLTNIAKHAQASAVEVRVSRADAIARVEVVDDGIGGADAAQGSGLRGLADRVEALDGRLHIVSPPNEGTRIWAEIPVMATLLAEERRPDGAGRGPSH
jgi:signal transduction histidine kinase